MIRSNRLIYNKGKGVSSETRPYSHLIYAACHEELNNYMAKNSFFYNFSKNIHIDWKQTNKFNRFIYIDIESTFVPVRDDSWKKSLDIKDIL